MKIRDRFPGIATVDFLFGLVIIFAFLLRLAIISINVDTAHNNQKREKLDDLYRIKMTWASADDLDLYVQDPVRHIVFFRRMADGAMVLDHDDTGMTSNMVTLPDGRVVKSALDEENVVIKSIIPGEYIVNVHCYNKNDQKDPTKAMVTLYQIANDEDVQVTQQVVVMYQVAQEETAFRFTLTPAGDIVDINRLRTFFVKAAQQQVPSRTGAPSTEVPADTHTPTPAPVSAIAKDR
jgi:hypothetical protein